MVGVFDPVLGHDLVAFEMTVGVIFACTSCGCWCDVAPRSLLRPCRQFFNRGSRADVKALLAGSHPRDKERKVGRPTYVQRDAGDVVSFSGL